MPKLPKPTAGDTSWFTHDRFGLSIHWGLYSSAARHEWIKNWERISDEDYQKYFDHFDPDLYDPTVWAKEARNAGVKYFVITTKHHDGFCLWDSAFTDYKATNSPAGHDLLTPMLEAFRAEGIKVGLYHSLIDWHHPEFPIDELHPMRDNLEYRESQKHRDVRKYAEYLHGQVRELLTQFGKIDMLCFDFSYAHWRLTWSKGKGKDDWQSEKLLAMVRELQPHIIVNDRLDLKGTADYYTPEQYQPTSWFKVDGKPVVWMAWHTLNISWGYDRDQLQWKSPDLIIRMLIDTVSKGGNFNLNVGPNARGEFEPKAIEHLREIGEWMRLHGRSIYGCTGSGFTPPPDCRYTQNGKRLYLHIFAWPYRHVHLPGLAGKTAYAQLLNDASEVKRMEPDQNREIFNTTFHNEEGTLVLELPVVRPDVAVPVVELFLK